MEFMILVHMTRINWYLTTVNTQLIYFTGEVRIADKLTDGELPSVSYVHAADIQPSSSCCLLLDWQVCRETSLLMPSADQEASLPSDTSSTRALHSTSCSSWQSSASFSGS